MGAVVFPIPQPPLSDSGTHTCNSATKACFITSLATAANFSLNVEKSYGMRQFFQERGMVCTI